MVEVQAVERRELVDGHVRLGDERPGLEHDDRPAGAREVRRDDAAAGARADDDDVGVEDDRVVAADASPRAGRGRAGTIGVGSAVTGSGRCS